MGKETADGLRLIDTAEFAVESIGKWWKKMGRRRFPAADEIYITCDGGGSNGSHCRLWRKCLQKFVWRSREGLSVISLVDETTPPLLHHWGLQTRGGCANPNFWCMHRKKGMNAVSRRGDF